MSLQTGQRTILVEGGSDARYLATGHLLYANRQTLFAAPFDHRSGKLTGGPVPVVNGVLRTAGGLTGGAQISHSRTGDLVYLPGPYLTGRRFIMGFSDRNGKVERLNIPDGPRGLVRISPDGARIAFAADPSFVAENAGNVLIYDRSTNGAVRRLTYGGTNRYPIWTADGTRVVFQSDRERDLAIFWQKADGTRDAERLTRAEKGTSHVPESWSPTTDTLLYSVESPSGITLRTLSIKTGKSEPFGDVSSVLPPTARFSPDGKWIAYAIAERPGPTSIYVQPFPATGVKYQLIVKGSNSTPHKPMWSPDGKELFYVPRFGGFEAVPVSTRPEFAFGSPVEMVRSFTTGAPNAQALHDVAPDGRFLAMFDSELRLNRLPRLQDIGVVLNWFEDLKARVPSP
jgi:Tol biopolymer transport system component